MPPIIVPSYDAGLPVGSRLPSNFRDEIVAVVASKIALAMPLVFSAATAVVGVTPTDRAPFSRTLTGARMRVASGAVGSDLVAQVQSFAGSVWITLGTLTISAGSIIEASALFSQAQITGDLVRINVTSVGSTTPATGVVVEVAWSF